MSRISAVGRKRRLEQRFAEFEGLFGQPDGFVEIVDIAADLDAIWEHSLGETTDIVALLKDRLGCGVGLGNQFFRIVGMPEEFVALESPEELGLGNVGGTAHSLNSIIREAHMRVANNGSGTTLRCASAAQ